MFFLSPTPIVYHMSSALSSAAARVKSAVVWHDSCKVLCIARAGWGPYSDARFGVVVTDVCGEGLKWPNEDD